MMKKLLRLGGNFLPYVDMVMPLLERAIGAVGNETPAALQAMEEAMEKSSKEWRAHLQVLQAAQQEVLPALAEQQRRLDRLEQRSVEISETLANLVDTQTEMTQHVRALARGFRYAAILGIILLVAILATATLAFRHKLGH